MEQEKINRLQWILDDAVARGEIPGAILMVRKEGKETVYLESGYADIEAKKPVSRDSIYRLYSMSKPITATAVMILVERGLIDLADPVCRYLPGFCGQMVAAADGHVEKPWRDVTIQDLVNMTSGLVYDGNHLTGKQTEALFAEVIQGLDEGEGGAYGTVEIANRLGQIPLAFQPARSWCYGTSADVAGALVEVVSGMRFGDFLEKEIFTPLEMVDTGFWVPEEKQSRLVKTYECNEGKPSLLYTGNHLGIQIDLLREMLIEILFNKMTFPRKFVCGGEIRDGDGVAVDQLDQDLKKVLTDVDIIFLFFPELLDQGLGVKKHFFSVGTKIADRVWQKCIVGRTKRDSVQSQNDIFQSIFSVAELRMCHVRIDQYQVVFYNRERIIFCLKNTGSVNDIKKFGESMGMKNTLPVPVIAGFADIEKPDVQPFVG